MKKLIAFTFSLTFLFGCNNHPKQLSTSAIPFSINSSTKIPIGKVKLNGKDAYFIFDSGSSITIINQDDADKYGISYDVLNSGVGKGIGGSAEIYTAYNAHITYGDHVFSGKIYVSDLSGVKEGMKESSGYDVIGIIGSQSMQLAKIIIDYQKDSIFINNTFLVNL